MKLVLPIRVKLALASAGLSCAAVVCFAAGTLLNLYEDQIEAADEEIVAEARHVAQLYAVNPHPEDSLTRMEITAAKTWITFAVFDADGVFHKSDITLPDAVVEAANAQREPRTVRIPGGAWRVQAFTAGTRTVVVAHHLDEVDDIIHDLLSAYLISLPVFGVVIGWGGWMLAGRALAPVRAVTAAAAAINRQRIDRRVPTPPVDDEIGRLADVINAMLGRLENSLRQAERFAGDASHELRTPLTIMSGEIDAVLRRAHLEREDEDRLISVQEEIERLSRITENLLLLARLDAGAQGPASLARVDLSSLVSEACEDAQLLASTRRVTLDAIIAPGLSVRGNPDLLRRLVLNLLDNATKFNVAEGRVSCLLEERERQIVLKLTNTGPGIARDLQPHVFERFFRVDPARGRSGHGLGLALSREIARAHGGDLTLERSVPGATTVFQVVLPPSGTPKAPVTTGAGRPT